VYGELGIGTTTNEPRLTEIQFPTSTKIIQIVSGGCHSLALSDDGAVYAWGCNMYIFFCNFLTHLVGMAN
jgi:alpha-tubulin suppressor-like RCC1 family protein